MDIEPNRKLVLLAYADHARDDGTHIFPSVARIAEKTGLSRRWVQILTHELAQAGLLINDGRGPRGQNRWRIGLPSSGASTPLPSAAVTAAPNLNPGTAAQSASPATGASSSPVHSSASWGEVHLTPGANPTSPEPSLTIINHQGPSTETEPSSTRGGRLQAASAGGDGRPTGAVEHPGRSPTAARARRNLGT
jgi:Helix-turn-helix domain